MSTRPPLPPFTRESAIQKVRLAEDAWNSMGIEAEAPGARVCVVTVTYGLPLVVPVGLYSVTPAARLVNTSCRGPAIDCWD